MACTFTPSTCHINLGAIARNFKRLGDPEKLMPVIKADAYGHGLKEVAKTLLKAGSRRFAVGTVPEAMELRNMGFGQTVLPLLGCMNNDERQKAIAEDILLLADSFDEIEALKSVACGRHIRIALKFDTGMSRLGFDKSQISHLLTILSENKNLEPVIALSHLACADMPEKQDFTQKQTRIFKDIVQAIKTYFPDIKTSLGNSAICGMPSEVDGIFRPGIALYGGNPLFATRKADSFPEVEWAMSVCAPILQVRDLPAGRSISYGQIFTSVSPMRIAIVAAGYATGVARSLSNNINLIVNGRLAKQVGRICMNMLMVDVTDIPDAQPGNMAWIMGCEDNVVESANTAEKIAEMLNTIPYEILCLFGAMNPRVYHE